MDTTTETATVETATTESAVADLSKPAPRRGRPKGTLSAKTLEKLTAAGHDLSAMSAEEKTDAAKQLRKSVKTGAATSGGRRGRPAGSFNESTVKAVAALGVDLLAMDPGARGAFVKDLRAQKKI